MSDTTPPVGGSEAPASPPKTGRDSRVWWAYLANYVLLGCAALIIAVVVWEAIENGKWVWYKFGLPLLFIATAIANFAAMHARERKRAELGTAPVSARESGSGNS